MKSHQDINYVYNYKFFNTNNKAYGDQQGRLHGMMMLKVNTKLKIWIFYLIRIDIGSIHQKECAYGN